MTYVGGAEAGAAAAAAIAQAIKASGVIVKMDPADFAQILGRQSAALVVTAIGGFFTNTYRYLTSYKGIAFYCESKEPLPLPGNCEVVASKKIWIPN